MNEARTIIFFGPSGAGKGTQAKLLQNYLKDKEPDRRILYISTGALFREFIESDTYTAYRVKEILEKGGLLPEFLPIWIWTNFLNQNVKDNTEHLIFDGMARRADEAPVLDSAISFYERSVRDVVVINVSEKLSMKRLKERGRYDDSGKDIKERLQWYKTDVVPSINYFRSNSAYNVHDINGERSVEDVYQDILKCLKL